MDLLLQKLRTLPEPLGGIAAMPRVWLVGGWLRRAYYGRGSHDLDLAVGKHDGVPPDQRMGEIATLLGAAVIPIGERFGARRLILEGGWQVDMSPLTDDDISADLRRRDYTVNTLAVELAALQAATNSNADDAQLLTLVQGAPDAFKDLSARTIRMLSTVNLSSDPLRILRGYRLAATDGLRPELETRKAWHELAGRVVQSAPERIHEELLAWFGAPLPEPKTREPILAVTLRWAAEDCVLWQLFPALEAAQSCEQNTYHHLNVWMHTLEAMLQLDKLRVELPEELAAHCESLDHAWNAPVGLSTTGGAMTRLALLLHDVAKPPTREVQPDGRISFHGHQDIGAYTARDMLERIRFSRDEIDCVALLIAEHLRLGFYCKELPMNPRLVYRYCARLGSLTPLMVMHSLADCLATRGEGFEASWAAHVAAAKQVLDSYYAADSAAAPPLYLDGNDIMRLLGIPAGREVGTIKTALLEATAAGEVNSPAEAEAFVRATPRS